MAIDNNSKPTVLAGPYTNVVTASRQIDLTTSGLFAGDTNEGGYQNLTTNQDDIVVIRQFDDSGMTTSLTASEAWSAWTLPNATDSGSVMYTLSNEVITFADDEDFVWTSVMSGRGANVTLPALSDSDTIYVLRKTRTYDMLTIFQPSARVTAKNLNAALGQAFFIGQESQEMIQSFHRLNPALGKKSGVCPLSALGLIDKSYVDDDVFLLVKSDDSTAWDAKSKRISQVATGITDGEAVNKGQMNSNASLTNYHTISNLDNEDTGCARLVGGLLQSANLPSITISTYKGEAANFAAIDNLAALPGEVGDWARTASPSKTYIITSGDGTTADGSDWTEVTSPAAPIDSVNGETGVVYLNASHIGTNTTTEVYSKLEITGTIIGDFSPDQSVKAWAEATFLEDVAIGDATEVTAAGGNTARTLADHFANWVNVKDHGALGDDSTNDTVAIQRAADVINNGTDQGVLYFPEGTYRIIDNIQIKKGNVIIRGDGAQRSVIKSVSLNAHTPFTFDGDAGDATTTKACFIVSDNNATAAASKVFIQNVKFLDLGINVVDDVLGFSTPAIAAYCVHHFVVDSCRIDTTQDHNYNAFAVLVQGEGLLTSRDHSEGLEIRNSQFSLKSASAIRTMGVDDVNVSFNNIVHNSTTRHATGVVKIDGQNTGLNDTLLGAVICNNYIEGKGTAAADIGSGDVYTGERPSEGIHIEQGHENIIISGNSIKGFLRGIVGQTGSTTSGNMEQLVITANNIQSCEAAGIDISSTANVSTDEGGLNHVITNNTILSNCKGVGIRYWYDDTPDATPPIGVIISGNSIMGIQTAHTTRANDEVSAASGNLYAGTGIYASGENVCIANNTLKGCQYRGIWTYKLSYSTITGNTVRGSVLSELFMDLHREVTITGNLFWGSNSTENHTATTRTEQDVAAVIFDPREGGSHGGGLFANNSVNSSKKNCIKIWGDEDNTGIDIMNNRTSGIFGIGGEEINKTGAATKGHWVGNTNKVNDAVNEYDEPLAAVGSGVSLVGLKATSASAGSETLPDKPVAFILISVEGLSYKVPYYGM